MSGERDPFEIYSEPSGWPVWVRRAFLLTIPISGPLWVLGLALMLTLCVAVFLIWGLIDSVHTFWSAKP